MPVYLWEGFSQTIEKVVSDQTFYLTQSQYTDTGPTSRSTDAITPGTWQGSHCSAHFSVTGMTRPGKNAHGERGNRAGSAALRMV